MSTIIMDPCTVVGDFNSIMGAHEKIDPPPKISTCTYIRETMDAAKLIPIYSKGLGLLSLIWGHFLLFKVGLTNLFAMKNVLVFGRRFLAWFYLNIILIIVPY